MPTNITNMHELKGGIMNDLIYNKESYKILGACFQVYNQMGSGFLEAVYQECLEIEFQYQQIPFCSQKEIQLTYRNMILNKTFKPDFICYGKIIVEIKSVSQLLKEHQSQVLNYLNATNFKLGLLVNFGQYPKVEYKR